MASNAKTTSEGSPVAQTPVVTKARRVRKPSAPVKKVYHVGSKAVILDPHKIVGTITELTNSGSISATIKIDADGRVVNATLNPSDDFWYRPKKAATLFFPGVPGAAVTLAHQRLPQTVEDPKPVPREALGLPPLPAGACDSDSDSADQNNAVNGKRRAVDQNKGKEAQGKNKAIASGSELTYTVTRDLEVPPKDVSEPPVSSSDPTLKSADDISNKGSAATSLASGSPPNTELAGSTSTDVPLTTAKNMAPQAQSATKRKRDATAGGDASKKPKSETGGSTTVETLEDGSKVINNYNGSYFDLRGVVLQLPQASAPGIIPQGHQHVAYYDAVYGYRYQTFLPQPGGPTAQGAAAAPRPASQAPMLYQVPHQAGSPLAPYSATQPQGRPAVPYSTDAPAPAGYYDQTSYQNPQSSPYAMDTRFRDQTSPVASSSRGPGTYSQHPQYPQ